MAHNQSFNYSEVILDLDEITNVGHPCWELLQPSPNVYQLFDEFNQRFFTGILDFRVDIDWCPLRGHNKDCAGLTELPHKVRNNKILITLNEKLLGLQSRRETIEILLHEMIHAFLIHTNREDSSEGTADHHHGPNFHAKMNEIRTLTGLNITIAHNFAEQNSTSYYIWRCGGNCRYTAPYFGFVWVKERREPSSGDLMWIDREYCEHRFERVGNGDQSKERLCHWECILNFNEFVSKKRIHVKTKKLHLTDFNENTLPPFNDSFELHFQSQTAEDAAPPIPYEYYVNFDRKTMQFVNVDSCLTVGTVNGIDANSHTVCMICLCKIVESNEAVLQHLKECTGVKFKFDPEESLPIFKII